MLKKRVSLLIGALIAVTTCVPVFAQVTRGSLSGTLSDSSGAVLVGALVTLTNTETGATRMTTSTNEGSYRLEGLELGSYTIRLASKGFEEFNRTGITVTGRTELADIQLKPSMAPAESTLIVGGGPLLPTARPVPSTPTKVPHLRPKRRTRTHHHRFATFGVR